MACRAKAIKSGGLGEKTVPVGLGCAVREGGDRLAGEGGAVAGAEDEGGEHLVPGGALGHVERCF